MFLRCFDNLICAVCACRPCLSSSDVLFSWAAFLSINLLSSVLPHSFPRLFLFPRPCMIHALMRGRSRAFVHGHTFLHSWSGLMTLVVGLLHRATFLSNLNLVLLVLEGHLLNPKYNINYLLKIIF